MKSLDAKLADIRANPGSSKAFIIADAKDPDMAFGVSAPGHRRYLSAKGAHPARFSPELWTRDEFGHRNLPELLDIIREVAAQGLVDIVLMSAHVNEQLTIKEGLFRDSHITPAARANDATDVWAARHGNYLSHAAQPFRSASIDHIQCGKLDCDRDDGDFPGANLGLYSITYLNDLERDKRTLEAFHAFREEAERKRFRYFLEVFDPNIESGIPPEKLGEFINDQILRTLAGIAELRSLVDGLRIVFLDCSTEVLVQRYESSRRPHPLGGDAGLADTIEAAEEAFAEASEREGLSVIVSKVEAIGPPSFAMDISLLENRFEFARHLRGLTNG